jgi:hypothetical protein
MKCEYGCGREAKYPPITGKGKGNGRSKWCCSKHYNSCPAVKEKKKKIFQDKYGVDYSFQIPEVKEKTKKTLQDKHGVDHPAQIPEVKEKTKKTFQDKHGVDNPSQIPEVKAKKQKTFQDKYGVDNPSQIPEVKEKTKKTFQDKHGVDNPSQIPEVKAKKQKTCQDKYGVDHPSQAPEARRKNRLKAIERINNRLENGYQVTPNYNPDVCDMIDELSKVYGYKFQHAQNGGEYYFKDLGYWVDGFNEEHVHIIEGDEPHHFNSDGNLIKKDVLRENELIEYCMKKYGKCIFERKRVYKNVSNTTLGRRRSIIRTSTWT